MDLVFVYEKQIANRFVPNGLGASGPFYQRFLKAEGEYGHEGFCRSPLLNVFREFDQEFHESLIGAASPNHPKIYLIEMLYSLAVWLPRPSGRESPLSPWPQIGEDALAQIRRGEAVLVLTHLKRPERDAYAYDIFYQLHSKLEQFAIPASQVIFIGAAADLPSHYEATVRARGIRERLRSVHAIPYFEWGWYTYFQRYLKSGQIYSAEAAANELARPRPWRYLCFNREPRAHRLVNALWLQSRGLLEKGLVSFPQEDRNFDFKKFAQYREGIADIFADPEIMSLAREFPRFRARLPLTVDHPHLFELHISWCTPVPFRDSYFSLLTERLFHNPHGQMLLTGKVYKAMCNMHPFLLIGPAGALKQVRAEGYQTFAPWFNEAYDEETDPNRRLQLVWQEMERLCALPLSEMATLYRALFPVLKFNWAHFQKRNRPDLAGRNPVQRFAATLNSEIRG